MGWRALNAGAQIPPNGLRGDTLKQIPRREIAYLNVGSGASEEVSGPYHFPQMTLRVMPLRAEKAKLQDLLDRYLRK